MHGFYSMLEQNFRTVPYYFYGHGKGKVEGQIMELLLPQPDKLWNWLPSKKKKKYGLIDMLCLADNLFSTFDLLIG